MAAVALSLPTVWTQTAGHVISLKSNLHIYTHTRTHTHTHIQTLVSVISNLWSLLYTPICVNLFNSCIDLETLLADIIVVLSILFINVEACIQFDILFMNTGAFKSLISYFV